MAGGVTRGGKKAYPSGGWLASHLLLTWIVLTGWVAAQERAPALPAELSDEDFWQLIVDVSESDGHFEDENFVSNELGYHRARRNAPHVPDGLCHT